MKTSVAGRAAISRREGNKFKAYKDSVGIWTIGVGHTSVAGSPRVEPGMTITAVESDEILSRDLAKFERAVDDAVKVELTQNQFDALVSLAFNIGGGAFAKSSVVKRLNQGDINGAANAFLFWNKAGGKVLPGLTNRRKQEREQFLWAPIKKPAPLLSPVATPSPVIEPKPSPAPVPVPDKEKIARVQIGLKLLNYNPGGADGVIGPLTAGAIRIFRADNGLPEGDFIDDDLLAALASAKPREMVAARANATPKQVAAAVPEANAHWWNKWLAGGGVGGGTILAIGDAIAPAKSYVDQLREDVPAWAWFILFAIFCGGIAWMALRGQKASDAAYRTGDRR